MATLPSVIPSVPDHQSEHCLLRAAVVAVWLSSGFPLAMCKPRACVWRSCCMARMHTWRSVPIGGPRGPHLLVSPLSSILPGNFPLKSKSVDRSGLKGMHTFPILEMPFRVTAEDLYLYQSLAVPLTSLEGSFEGFVSHVPAASCC